MVDSPLSPYANFFYRLGMSHQLYTLHFYVPLSTWMVEKCTLGYVVPNSQTVVLNFIPRFSVRLHHPQASSLCVHKAFQHLKLQGKNGFGMQTHEEKMLQNKNWIKYSTSNVYSLFYIYNFLKVVFIQLIKLSYVCIHFHLFIILFTLWILNVIESAFSLSTQTWHVYSHTIM